MKVSDIAAAITVSSVESEILATYHKIVKNGEITIPDGYEVVGFRIALDHETILTFDSGDPLECRGGFALKRLILKRKPIAIGWNVRKLGRPPEVGDLYIMNNDITPSRVYMCGANSCFSYNGCEAVVVDTLYE